MRTCVPSQKQTPCAGSSQPVHFHIPPFLCNRKLFPGWTTNETKRPRCMNIMLDRMHTVTFPCRHCDPSSSFPFSCSRVVTMSVDRVGPSSLLSLLVAATHARACLDSATLGTVHVNITSSSIVPFQFDLAASSLLIHVRTCVDADRATIRALMALLRYHRRSGHVRLMWTWCVDASEAHSRIRSKSTLHKALLATDVWRSVHRHWPVEVVHRHAHVCYRGREIGLLSWR